MRIPILAAGVALLSTLSAHADFFPGTFLTDYDLGGSEFEVYWSNLSSQNPTRTSALGTGSLALGGSPAFGAQAGIYSPVGPYTVTTTKSDFASDVQTIVLQLQWAPNTAFEITPPTLTFNGGTLELPATWGDQTLLSTTATVASGVDATFVVHTWQWDLSSVAEAITSVSITSPASVHTQLVGISLDASTAANTQQVFTAVPEPSTGVLAGLGVAALAFRRRRERVAA